MQSGKNQRLLTKITELQNQFELLSEKLSKLKEARVIETDPSSIFKLDKEITKIEADRQNLEDQLSNLESQLAPETNDAGAAVSAPSEIPNPFGEVGRIETPDHFFDREELLRQIFEELDKGSNLSLVGESQIGKSSLLAMICVLGPERMRRPPDMFAYLSIELVDNEEDFYKALCEKLGLEECRGYKLARALEGKRYVLCLDEIEAMKGEGFTVKVRRHLRGLADGSSAPLRLVIASRSPLDRLFPDSPELTSPLAGICQKLDVGPFPPEVARQFLQQRLAGTSIAFTPAQINELITKTGGHPAKLQNEAAKLYRKLTSLL